MNYYVREVIRNGSLRQIPYPAPMPCPGEPVLPGPTLMGQSITVITEIVGDPYLAKITDHIVATVEMPKTEAEIDQIFRQQAEQFVAEKYPGGNW